MSRAVTALFDNAAPAHIAVQDLVNAGYRHDDISLLAQPPPPDAGAVEETGTPAAVGVGAGAALGDLGGLLVGLGALAIPGIGPVVAAGPLAAALAGASLGAAAGGISGVLAELGVPEEQAGSYAEAIRRGGVLVTVRAHGAEAERAIAIMRRHHPVDLDERVAQWRAQGWTSFDPEGPGYTTDDLRVERERLRARPAPAPAEGEDLASPAMRLGHEMALNARYGDADWTMVEPEARRQWEERGHGAWSEVRDAVRSAWERARAHRAA